MSTEQNMTPESKIVVDESQQVIEQLVPDEIPVITPDPLPPSSDGSVLETESSASQAAPSHSVTASLLGKERNLVQVAPHLFAPSEWVDEFATHPCGPLASEFLSRLSPLATAIPWLVTSMSLDLNGTPRSDSKDHSAGRAMDISPMYSEDVILPEAPPIMGLAWNIKSLIALSEGQWGDMPLFIEGDHVHFSADIAPDSQGCLPIMWSDSDAYPSMASQQYDPILSRLRNSFWRWSTESLTLEPPSVKLQQVISRLLHPAGEVSVESHVEEEVPTPA